MGNGPNMMPMIDFHVFPLMTHIDISILTLVDVEDNNHQMGVMKKCMRLWDEDMGWIFQ